MSRHWFCFPKKRPTANKSKSGQLYGFVKDEKKYFYLKDITGTILGIVNESGTLVGKYS